MRQREYKRHFDRRHSIQTRLILLLTIVMILALLINLFIYSRINDMVQRVDTVFASNVTVNELTDNLSLIEDNVYEYLNTKSSGALENYYRYSQTYADLLSELNDTATDDPALMLEMNIRSMSESYLAQAEETVGAKRGRNVEQYRSGYEKQEKLYNYINQYIYELDRIRFSDNSQKYKLLQSSIHELELLAVIIIIVAFSICILIAVQLIRNMIHPLVELSDAANQVADGNMDVEVLPIDSEDEVGVVNNAFGQMLRSIRDYISALRDSMEKEADMKQRELAMEAGLKDAQLRYLQAQINPHFLFNCLNAGAQLAAMEDADQTNVFLGRMADFFRYNVKKTDGRSLLGEEVAAVDNYIYILNVRFAGDIHYEKQVEEGYEDIEVPALFLQPLVENAVSHGIHDMEGDGQIRLDIYPEEEYLHVVVKDNGAGMSPENAALITAGKDLPGASTSGSTGIGLKNVIRRLQLFYGREDLFSIVSEGKGMGTEVHVRIPIPEGE